MMAVKKPTKAKVIRSADGIERVAQACDRCRSKKTKCDGKRPQCSQCASVGFECKISDRLSRRAFPRGYTESLEERVRELEAENRKLSGLIDLKDEQLELLAKPRRPSMVGNQHVPANEKDAEEDTAVAGSGMAGAANLGNTGARILNGDITEGFNSHSLAELDAEKSIFELSAANKLNSSNLSLLNQLNGPKIHTHEAHEQGCNCGCAHYPHSVHERPTSISASVVLDAEHVDEDDAASLLSFDSEHNNNVDAKAYNFFDDNKKQFDNLRNGKTDNGKSDCLRSNKIDVLRSNKNVEAGVPNLYNNTNNMNSYFNHFNVSFEQKEAPGAAAAMAIASVNNDKSHLRNQIAALVAMSTPRTTEEMLFIPSLIGKVGNVHGFNSKPAVLTARTLALLKVTFKTKNQVKEEHTINLKNINFNKISKAESHLFFTNLKLPSRLDLDQLITFYFQEWAAMTPVVDQQEFLKNYMKLTKSAENRFNDNDMFQRERFGAICLLVVTLALLGRKKSSKYKTENGSTFFTNSDNSNGKSIKFINSGVKNNTPITVENDVWTGKSENTLNGMIANENDDNTTRLLNYYDALIKQLIASSIVDFCSMQSLQILTLALIYTLNVSDVETSYILRGKVVSMAQQLRLHRCPSAVLSNSGSIVLKVQQSERRILFWSIYTLDVFSSLQLGVPRLIKDYEIECALPFANDDLDDSNNTNILIINNAKLSLVGKVSNFSLSIMRYAKILGNILDSIFRRGGITIDALGKSCIILEDLLENWRKDLPSSLRFDLDVNGLLKNNEFKNYSNKTLSIITLYYQAKMLIYLPVLAAELHSSRGSSSYITIQQSSNTILSITNYVSQQNYFLPAPANPSRMRARYGLLAAKGALEYTRGGNLFQDLKGTLMDLTNDLKVETAQEVPGCLAQSCIRTFEDTIQAILSPPKMGNPLSMNKSLNRKRSSSFKQQHSGPNIGGSALKNVSSRFIKIEPNMTGNSRSQSRAATEEPLRASIFQNDSQTFLNDVSYQQTNHNQQTVSDFSSTVTSSNSNLLSAQPMSDSNSQISNSTNQVTNKVSPEQGFEVDESVFSEFAADGSLGLAQLLDIDLDYNFSDTDQLTDLINGNYNASNVKAEPSQNFSREQSLLNHNVSTTHQSATFNDNNIPTDSFMKFENSFFQWQK